ncbi:MAG: SpoIIE family protein phosphatase [Clostridia bacterium]|nr:SpoIIE family protein phosphatase [Clostridia bacterium]
MILKLLIPVLCNAVLAVLLYMTEKKTTFGKADRWLKQCIIGVLFGALAIFSTEYGVDVGGAVMNVRDASPLCAGLIFGAPAGIISGVIGGAYRWLAVFWGAGEYTRLACSVSAVLAGCIAALLRKHMFDDKKPSWIYGLGVGMVCEVLHMLMIFLTNMKDASRAFTFVQSCTLPMVMSNGIAVGLAVMAVSLLGREKVNLHNEKKQISQTFQFWLFICIVIAYIVTSGFTYILQTGMSGKETESVININIDDVHKDITDASDENLLKITRTIRSEYLSDDTPLYILCERYNVKGINIVDQNGIITNSTLKEFIGYDMASGEQSAEFLVLLDGEEEFVQKYQPLSIDESISRKYAGVCLPDGGFIQVGYDAEQFRKDIDERVIEVTKNRHIGNNGFVAICDENLNIVIDRSDYSGKNLNTIGVSIDTDVTSENTVFEAEIYGKPYFLAYTFAEGYYIIGAIPKSEAMFMRNVSIYVSIFMEILIFAALFTLIYFLIKKVIIDNLRKINGTLAEITDGNLNVTVDVRTNEEFASLSDDINQTVSTLKRYIAEAAARIDKELEFAKEIQYSALPSVFPPYPNRKDFEIYAHMITAKEVGGDFYDFYMLGDSMLAFMIADVSGKGIPAAMFMMQAKTIIKDLAESGLELSEIFMTANKKLCENNEAGMFVTAWMGILDLKTGRLKFVNAGHNPPLVRQADGEFAYLKARSGMVLAGMDGIKYRQNELQLTPGDQIFLYTDGVTEATDKNNQLYGEERLLETVNRNIVMDTRKLCEAVKSDVDQFVGEAPQFDDITMLSVEIQYIRGENSITVIADDKSMIPVSEFAKSLTEKLAVVPKVANKVSIAVDEIYSNIINYSGADLATISYEIKDGRLYMTFTDDGIPYNPIKAEEPDVTLSAEERKIGGLGIFMVKKMTESMEYTYEDEKNILKLIIALS